MPRSAAGPGSRAGSPTPILLALLIATGAGADAEPLHPRAILAPGPYFVGQAIDLRIELAGEGRPAVVAPRVTGADVEPAEGGIRVIARKAGTLVIPPMAVRWGGRLGKTAPIRLAVRDLPAVGRPASFLGGVGPLTVEAEARPAAVRVGEALEFRVRLTGPGARGSTSRPRLEGPALEVLGIRVEPLPDEVVAGAAGRVLRARLRPARPGEGVLPPVAVSYFDPKSERYMTRASAGVPIRVEAVPTLDPSALDYGSRAAPEPSGLTRDGTGMMGRGLLGVIAVAVAVGIAYALRPDRSDPRRLAGQLARELDRGGEASEVARGITDGLADYLTLAIGRPRGVLTPVEARREVAAVAGDEAIGVRAGGLVAECDRIRYGGGGPTAGGLVAEAEGLFRELAKIKVETRRAGLGGGEPREAPPTAKR